MSENGFQCVRTETVSGVRVVHFLDDKVMDPARIEQLGNELREICEAEAKPQILLNFAEVKFFSSAAINKLIVIEKRVRAKGGMLRLSDLRPEVRDLFGFTHLDTLFKIHNQQAEALAAF